MSDWFADEYLLTMSLHGKREGEETWGVGERDWGVKEWRGRERERAL